MGDEIMSITVFRVQPQKLDLAGDPQLKKAVSEAKKHPVKRTEQFTCHPTDPFNGGCVAEGRFELQSAYEEKELVRAMSFLSNSCKTPFSLSLTDEMDRRYFSESFTINDANLFLEDIRFVDVNKDGVIDLVAHFKRYQVGTTATTSAYYYVAGEKTVGLHFK